MIAVGEREDAGIARKHVPDNETRCGAAPAVSARWKASDQLPRRCSLKRLVSRTTHTCASPLLQSS